VVAVRTQDEVTLAEEHAVMPAGLAAIAVGLAATAAERAAVTAGVPMRVASAAVDTPWVVAVAMVAADTGKS
jgi:hypothetical protein